MPFYFNSKLELFGEVWWVTENCNYNWMDIQTNSGPKYFHEGCKSLAVYWWLSSKEVRRRPPRFKGVVYIPLARWAGHSISSMSTNVYNVYNVCKSLIVLLQCLHCKQSTLHPHPTCAVVHYIHTIVFSHNHLIQAERLEFNVWLKLNLRCTWTRKQASKLRKLNCWCDFWCPSHLIPASKWVQLCVNWGGTTYVVET